MNTQSSDTTILYKFFFLNVDQDIPVNVLWKLTTFSPHIKYIQIQFRAAPEMSVLTCIG